MGAGHTIEARSHLPSAPQPCAPKIFVGHMNIPAVGLRLHEVRGDRFEPVARNGDFVILAPAAGWIGAADYLVARHDFEPQLYHCDALGTAAEPIRLCSPNPLYREPWTMSREAFDAAVVGIVVATLQVSQPELLRGIYQSTPDPERMS